MRVTRWWAGVDSVWEQEKLEARKMLETAQTLTSRVHTVLAHFWFVDLDI